MRAASVTAWWIITSIAIASSFCFSFSAATTASRWAWNRTFPSSLTSRLVSCLTLLVYSFARSTFSSLVALAISLRSARSRLPASEFALACSAAPSCLCFVSLALTRLFSAARVLAVAANSFFLSSSS